MTRINARSAPSPMHAPTRPCFPRVFPARPPSTDTRLPFQQAGSQHPTASFVPAGRTDPAAFQGPAAAGMLDAWDACPCMAPPLHAAAQHHLHM